MSITPYTNRIRARGRAFSPTARPLLALAIAAALLAAACSTGTPSGQPAPAGAVTPVGEVIDTLVTVAPGRDLAVNCSGSGSPAVIYLHGLIQPDDGAQWAHEPGIRARITPSTRYCEYERTNVGASSQASGPIPITESVADLDAILDRLGITEPVILLGGSFGGLIAYTYAGTHPDRVAGIVLLDPTLPDEPALDHAYIPKQDWLTPDSWQDSKEKIDIYRAYAVAQRALRTVPPVPGTIFVTKDLWAPDGKYAESFRRGVRSQQRNLIAHFQPHRTVTVDTPHAMASEIPDQIAYAALDLRTPSR